MPTLNVTLVQLGSTLDPEENRRLLEVLDEICAGRPKPHLIVLPEAFACDFGKPGTDISGYAEAMDGPFVRALTAIAKVHQVAVIAGMFESSDDPTRPYNTLVVVDSDGLRAKYRKIHLYDSFGYKESDRLLAGEVDPVIVDVGGVQVGLMTCYDLRFPELARELVKQGADLLVVPSAWVAGERKLDHWRTLVKARAIENTVYVAAVAQPEPRYTGHSMIVDPAGDGLEASEGDLAVVSTVDTSMIDKVRTENPSLANRRF